MKKFGKNNDYINIVIFIVLLIFFLFSCTLLIAFKPIDSDKDNLSIFAEISIQENIAETEDIDSIDGDTINKFPKDKKLVYRPLSSLIYKSEEPREIKITHFPSEIVDDTGQFESESLVYMPLLSLLSSSDSSYVEKEEVAAVDNTEIPSHSISQDSEYKPTVENESISDIYLDSEYKEVGEEISAVKDDFKLLLEAEEDFFADFYIEGEDDLIFEDDTYYMDLYINGEERGIITVEMRDQSPALSTSELKMYLSDELIPEAYDRIFAGQVEFMTLEDLDEVGVETIFSSGEYRIDLNFTLSDIPTRVISMNTPSRILGVRRSISGANVIQPAIFSMKSTYNGYLSWGLRNFDKWYYALSLYSSNQISLFDTFFSFNYSLRYNGEKPSFIFGSYSLYHDFTEHMLRLSAGNVSSGILSPSGSAIGLRLEKSLSYQDGTYLRKSPYATTITVEKESRVEVINGDRTMYDKVLSPGNYRLEDFVLYSGVNRVLVRISPVDGSTPIEIIKEFSYYSSMLYPGEFYYGVSLTTGRETYTSSRSARDGAFGFSLGKKYYQYDYRNIALSADFSSGVTNSLSFSGAIAISNVPTRDYIFNPRGKVNMEFTHRNILGTTRYNLNLLEQRLSSGSYSLPSLYMRVGHQFSTGLRELSSINLGLAYASPESISLSKGHSLNANIGLSGRFGILGYSLGGSTYINLNNIDLTTYSAYSSLSLSLKGGVSLSASMNLSGGINRKPNVSGTVYFSYSFDSGSLSSTINESSIRTGINTSSDFGSFNFSMITPSLKNYQDFTKTDAYDFSAGYSASTSYFGLSLGINGDLGFRNLSGSASLSTSIAFADGYFALANSIPSSVLLIRQKGILKGNDISVGYSGSSTLANLDTFLGTAIYSGISSSRSTDIMLYSTNESAIGSPSSVSLSIPPSKNRMYVYTLKADAIYTISGIAEDLDNNLWINGSSPLYRIDVEGDNTITAIIDENNYVFTDDTGRFIISDITPGMYGFDIPYEDGWILALFTLDGDEKNALKMNIYKNEGTTASYILPEQYSSSIEYIFDISMTSDDFWQMVFPNAFGGDYE